MHGWLIFGAQNALFIKPLQSCAKLFVIHKTMYHSGWDSSESRQPGLNCSSEHPQVAVMRRGRGEADFEGLSRRVATVKPLHCTTLKIFTLLKIRLVSCYEFYLSKWCPAYRQETIDWGIHFNHLDKILTSYYEWQLILIKERLSSKCITLIGSSSLISNQLLTGF